MRRKAFMLIVVVFLVMVSGLSTAYADIACDAPNILIVLDSSGSMDGTSGTPGLTKWQAALQAMQYIMQLDTKVRYGLELFPYADSCDAKVKYECDLGRGSIINSYLASFPVGGTTPIATALQTADASQCINDQTRRRYVLFVTDGMPTCAPTDSGTIVSYVRAMKTNKNIDTFVVGFGSEVDPSLLNEMAKAGGTDAPDPGRYYYQANNAGELQQAMNDIIAIATTEICDNKDNDCDGQIDEGTDQSCSTACDTGTRKCVNGVLLPCDAVEPGEDICDGKDNDCNGIIDDPGSVGEGLYCNPGSGGCGGGGVQHCENGVLSCVPLSGVTDEVCDGLDNDCDGKIDEDAQGNPLTQECSSVCEKKTQTCQNGKWSDCTARQPSKEQCNGIDDDCDGTVDEKEDIEGLGVWCDSGLSGVCKNGVTDCLGGFVVCNPEAQPSEETCNGIDDDCDGTIDNNLDLSQECITSLPGICGLGTSACIDGQISCTPKIDVGSREEICNGLDDDCDGKIDEDVLNACGSCGPIPTESCNGLDDNCDGLIDNDAPCPAGSVCVSGECIKTCASGECPPTANCQNTDKGAACIPKCSGVKCDAGLFCEATTGECKDLCAGITCGDNERCDSGTCVSKDCHKTGCEANEMCASSGDCETNPCYEISCDIGKYCNNGECKDNCAYISCAANESCRNGICVPDGCKTVSCDLGKICDNITYTCVDDPCSGVNCNEGEVCQGGTCVGDVCNYVSCPQGQACDDGECVIPVDVCSGIPCPEGEHCEGGQCVEDTECTPSCDGKECGDDGCGGDCGSCDEGKECNAGICEEKPECTPSCDGKECGDDGCGGDCGSCGEGEVCNAGVCAGESSLDGGKKDTGTDAGSSDGGGVEPPDDGGGCGCRVR